MSGADGAGEKTIMVHGALDAWALGVVAFELLTRRQAFQTLVEGRESVRRHSCMCLDYSRILYIVQVVWQLGMTKYWRLRRW